MPEFDRGAASSGSFGTSRRDLLMDVQTSYYSCVAERRKPGEVRDAIVESLRHQGGTATVGEIVRAVESRLGGPVARSSVRSYLQNGSRFERLDRGRYKLLG